MGVLNNIGGSGISGFYLGVVAVVAVATYGVVRGLGLPFIGGGGNGDVFGGY